MRQDRRNVLATLSAAAGCALLLDAASPLEPEMIEIDHSSREVVTGIGGFFFRARDPKALAQWYLDHLGINLIPMQKGQQPWRQQAGATAFAPFPENTSYFGDPAKQWMMNFRVNNLDRLVAQLMAASISVKLDAEASPNGRFAHLHDPEGNPVELWQPVDDKPTTAGGT